MDLVQRARELYSAGRMHDALEAAQAACDRAPKDAEAWWLLGRIGRHIGLIAASDDAFRRAAALAHGRPVPYRVTAERFQELVEQVRGSLSPEAQRRLENVTLRLQPLPSVEDVRAGVDPDALTARRGQPAEVITVFQANLETRSGSEEALRALIGRSLSGA